MLRCSSVPEPEDRRLVERVEAVLEVRYPTVDEFVVAYTADISRGGMFVAASELRPVGSVVKIELRVTDRPAIKLIARVAHLREGWGEEERGMGMEFLDVEGPPIEDQLAQLFAETEPPAPLRAPPARIVVVDDVDAWREQVIAALTLEGHSVGTARNGVEALGLVLRQPPDLIVSDVQMPGMDGWQLLRMIRARPAVAHVPVIFLTTLSGEAERLKGYQLGVDDYLAKPFEPPVLVERVRRVLGRSRMRGEQPSRNSLRGDLSQVTLVSLLGFVELERRTGLLVVVADGGDMALLHVLDGRVVHIDMPDEFDHLRGVERLFAVLSWNDGWFELSAAEVRVEDDIGWPIGNALLEYARRLDEADRIA